MALRDQELFFNASEALRQKDVMKRELFRATELDAKLLASNRRKMSNHDADGRETFPKSHILIDDARSALSGMQRGGKRIERRKLLMGWDPRCGVKLYGNKNYFDFFTELKTAIRHKSTGRAHLLMAMKRRFDGERWRSLCVPPMNIRLGPVLSVEDACETAYILGNAIPLEINNNQTGSSKKGKKGETAGNAKKKTHFEKHLKSHMQFTLSPRVNFNAAGAANSINGSSGVKNSAVPESPRKKLLAQFAGHGSSELYNGIKQAAE